MRSRGRLLWASSLLFVAILAGCDTNLGEHSPITKQGHSMSGLWRAAVWTTLAIGAIVLSLIIWCLIRYRRRGRDDIPNQRQYVIWLEVLYTAIPIVLVLIFFAYSYVVQDRVDALSAHPDVTVEVRGFDWQWQFHYPDEGITVTGVPDKRPVLVLPVGETVRFVLTSRDVIHSFFVPGFLFKRDVIPGLTNRFEVEPEKVGLYRGFCAEFCGLGHATMTFEVRTMTKADFDQWARAHRDAS
jgi:cytochrome c oxidase subunit 2